MSARWTSLPPTTPPKTAANRPPCHPQPPAGTTAPVAAGEAQEWAVSGEGRPRFYPSTTRTPEGLLSARFVGYTPEQLQEVFEFTQRQHGAKLLTS